MLLHAIDAAEGDCLLLEDAGEFLLIDGGIASTFEQRLDPYLKERSIKQIKAAIVSHVDADHITGVLDLFADIERAQADGEADPVTVGELWHNAFGATVDTAARSIVGELGLMLGQAGHAQVAVANGGVAVLGISQGIQLQRFATKLGVALNPHTAGQPVTLASSAGKTLQLGATGFTVVGPSEANLIALRKKWIEWLDQHADAFASGDPQAMAAADASVPNLSSIVLFGTTAGGDVLLTGDARGDHILQGLEEAGLLAAGGRRPLRLLKLQHHGSERNISAEFLARLPAEIYLISANGKNGNPDLAVLEMIVDAAAADHRSPTIVVTNSAPSITQLAQTRPVAQFGYTLVMREPARHAVRIDLVSGTID